MSWWISDPRLTSQIHVLVDLSKKHTKSTVFALALLVLLLLLLPLLASMGSKELFPYNAIHKTGEPPIESRGKITAGSVDGQALRSLFLAGNHLGWTPKRLSTMTLLSSKLPGTTPRGVWQRPCKTTRVWLFALQEVRHRRPRPCPRR